MQLVKRCLCKAIGRSILTLDQLNTVLVEVEATINMRPLTYVYDDVEGVSYSISPSHLLYGQQIISLSNSEVTSTHDSLVKKCKQQGHTLNQFLLLWRRMYLMNLRGYHCVKGQISGGPEITVGDIVILKNDSTK